MIVQIWSEKYISVDGKHPHEIVDGKHPHEIVDCKHPHEIVDITNINITIFKFMYKIKDNLKS